MATEICAVCGKGTLHAHKGTYNTEFVDRGGNVQKLAVPNVLWQECDNCKEGFLDEAATQLIETARRHALGLLSPDEIRNFRLHLRKRQRQMSRLLGVGEKTYCRWESGHYIQSVAFDRYLRLLMEIPENVQLLEQIDAGVAVQHCNVGIASTFAHLGDVEPLQHAACLFTSLLERGQLYTTLAMHEAT
jgi:putative zinc finger/helix-turn-helix YgiT family protein